MARYCEALGKAAGLSEEETTLMFTAAPMHDIGKIGIPDQILLKEGPLTDEEYEVIKSHTTIGADVLAGSQHELVKMAESIALTHHENWDGTGYPNGLKGEEIPIVGRICAVCDVFDALTSQRPYKEAWTFEDAAKELQSMSGTKLDPTLVEAFLSILPEIIAIRAKFDHGDDLADLSAA
jgi:putative two-component system response regulator